MQKWDGYTFSNAHLYTVAIVQILQFCLNIQPILLFLIKM